MDSKSWFKLVGRMDITKLWRNSRIAGLLAILGLIRAERHDLPARNFLTKPENMDHLVSYYVMSRPIGFWGPVRAEAIKQGLIKPSKT